MAELAVARHVVARGGIEEDVGQVGAPGAAQVGVREAVERAVVVVVTGAGVPVAERVSGLSWTMPKGVVAPG